MTTNKLAATATALHIVRWPEKYHCHGITHYEVDKDNCHRHGITHYEVDKDSCHRHGITHCEVARKISPPRFYAEMLVGGDCSGA